MAVGLDCSTAAELFRSTDVDEWRAALDLYDRVVQLLDTQRTRRRKQSKKNSDDESLEQLDQWWGWLYWPIVLLSLCGVYCGCALQVSRCSTRASKVA